MNPENSQTSHTLIVLILFTLFAAAIFAGITFASESVAAGISVSIIFTVIALAIMWKFITIGPALNEVWYTLNAFTGETRFYAPGLSIKLPWEKRVIDSLNKGIIHCTRVRTEEDAPEDQYTTIESDVVTADWKVEWGAGVIDPETGELNYVMCRHYIKTDDSTKSEGVRAIIEAFLTRYINERTIDDIRRNVAEITISLATLFNGDEASEEELAYGIRVSWPQFKAVLEGAKIIAARGFIKESELARQVAINLGAFVNDDGVTPDVKHPMVMAFMEKIDYQKYDVTPGTTFVTAGIPKPARK